MKLETNKWTVETTDLGDGLESLDIKCNNFSARVVVQEGYSGFSVLIADNGKASKVLASYQEKQTYRVGLFDEHCVGIPKRTIKVLATTQGEAEKIATAKLNPKDSEFVHVMT